MAQSCKHMIDAQSVCDQFPSVSHWVFFIIKIFSVILKSLKCVECIVK